MDIIAAYQQVGSYRGAAVMCGTTHKTVRRVIAAHEAATAGSPPPPRAPRSRNFDEVAELVADKVRATKARVSAKRLLPTARAAGYAGSSRNFRRLVADAKRAYRADEARRHGRRPAVWTPGEVLAIDWGEQLLDGRMVHVFCAVLAWSRFRFVRFAEDERQSTTLAMLADCFEVLGGVPKVVLADRMACLKGGVVANVVVPAADYVRFAAHYGFRPDFCNAADPESKGIVERLVGYAKRDLLDPLLLEADPWAGGLAGLNQRARGWCDEVNAVLHSEVAAVPAERLHVEGPLLTGLPSLRLQVGPRPLSRKVDRLSCIRVGSARYSVPNRLIGTQVSVLVDQQAGRLEVIAALTGEVVAEHPLVAPGATSITDAHYGSSRPDTPRRAPRARTDSERAFLALGEPAEAFLTGAAAAGVTRLAGEVDQILALVAAHGTEAVTAALQRAVQFRRWRAADVRSILATGGHAPTPVQAGPALTMTLPQVPVRPLAAYAIGAQA